MLYRTRELTGAVDLNDVCRGDGHLFVRDGVGCAGRGEVARFAENELDSFLSSLTAAPGTGVPPAGHGPAVLGTVPFLPTEPAEFVVPRLTITKTADGRTFASVAGPDDASVSDASLDAALAEATTAERPVPSSNSFVVEPVMHVDSYLRTVTAARDAKKPARRRRFSTWTRGGNLRRGLSRG